MFNYAVYWMGCLVLGVFDLVLYYDAEILHYQLGQIAMGLFGVIREHNLAKKEEPKEKPKEKNRWEK